MSNLSNDESPIGGSDNQQIVTPRFQCPACRARQPLQNECRRCRADLSLIVAARRRIDFIREQLGQLTDGMSDHERLTKELQVLTGAAEP